MRFYTGQHLFYCGIDLHTRLLAVCVLDQAGTVVCQTTIPADKQLLLDTRAPFRTDVGVGVECLFAWYWVADLCAAENIPFVLGHALYLKAIHGGKKIGNAHLKWAFSEAVCLLVRCGPAVKARQQRREKKHGQKKTLGILAAKLGRAVYLLLRRRQAFEVRRFLGP